MKSRLTVLVLLLAAFSLYTAQVVASDGLTGFLALALAEPWGGQMFVDLVIALVLFMVWMVGDARAHQIPAWPYVVAILATGSIGALAYLVHRETRLVRAPAPSPA